VFRFNFLPREDRFFNLFEQAAQNMVKTARGLKNMVDNWEDISKKVAEITELEHSGDSITHEIMSLLNRTFVPPLDREDIALLAHALDDVTDFIQAAADNMLLYRVEAPGQRVKELADIIVQVASEVEKAIPCLRPSKGRLKEVLPLCVEINRLENVADRVYRSAVAELFDENKQDIARLIKWREILEQMETATDRCEDVANVLEGVALKHA
jgi:hypothetical protein